MTEPEDFSSDVTVVTSKIRNNHMGIELVDRNFGKETAPNTDYDTRYRIIAGLLSSGYGPEYSQCVVIPKGLPNFFFVVLKEFFDSEDQIFVRCLTENQSERQTVGRLIHYWQKAKEDPTNTWLPLFFESVSIAFVRNTLVQCDEWTTLITHLYPQSELFLS